MGNAIMKNQTNKSTSTWNFKLKLFWRYKEKK